jgi:hypothetical protein
MQHFDAFVPGYAAPSNEGIGGRRLPRCYHPTCRMEGSGKPIPLAAISPNHPIVEKLANCEAVEQFLCLHCRLLVFQLVLTWTFDPSESFGIRGVLASPAPFSSLLDRDEPPSYTYRPPTNPYRLVVSSLFCRNSIFQCANFLLRVMNATAHHAGNLAQVIDRFQRVCVKNN